MTSIYGDKDKTRYYKNIYIYSIEWNPPNKHSVQIKLSFPN